MVYFGYMDKLALTYMNFKLFSFMSLCHGVVNELFYFINRILILVFKIVNLDS
jgi:hypothetical protein